MNKLLMTAFLLASACVSAQTVPAAATTQPAPLQSALVQTVPTTGAPVTPAPVAPDTMTPATAPATGPSAAPAPLTPAPATPAPATATPGTPAPASTPAAANTLRLTAPVGTAVTLSSVISTRMTMTDVKVTAAPGAKISQAKLNQMRRDVSAGFAKTKTMPAVTIKGKMTVKVAARDAAGRTTLVTDYDQSMPSGTEKTAKEMQNINMKITQVLSPEGKLADLKIESGNPQLNAAFKSLSADKLRAMIDQRGSNFSGGYGQSLVVGVPRTSTVNIDAQGMINGLLTSVTGAQGQEMFGKMQVSPLTVTTTTTYRGTDAQGRHVFEGKSTSGAWKINLNSAAGNKSAVQMKMEITDMTANSMSLYRPDGMPSSLKQGTDTKMKMTMTMEGMQISMNMNMTQQMNMQSR